MIKKIIFICGIFIIVAALGIISYSYDQIIKPLQFESSVETYSVQKGSSIRKVLNDFQQKGWLKNARMHELWLRIEKLTNIQSGEYQINNGDTSTVVINKMVLGKKTLRSVQFIEGKTFVENLERLESNPYLKHTISDQSPLDIIKRVDAELEHYEGWFFPDTYLFESGTTDIEILKMSYRRTKAILTEEWEARSDKAVVTSPYQALILASIIEKETGAAFERPMISGVFSRRLEQGMRLQTDPTVIYGLGESFNGNLTRTGLRKDTPYNTYTRKGLPPTPIANPGRKAISAALNPASGTAVFFVAKGDGTHQFSTTLREHNAAVRKYQRFGRRDDYKSSPEAEATQ